MKHKRVYLTPQADVFQTAPESVIAASGMTNSDFNAGGSLPGWENGMSTSSFTTGGALPNFN